MTHRLATVRQMWQLLEPIHATLYYAPEAFEEAAALGYATDERWPSYFAYRAAPLGPAGPQLVNALFYSLAPQMVERHTAPAWRTAAPEQVLEARSTAVNRALQKLLGDRIVSPEMREAAQLVRRATEGADTAGRPMAAANAALPWPDEPHMVLWQAATILREHRGDGHIAALQAHGIGPTESLVSHAAAGAAPTEVFRSRQWTDEEWTAARERLTARGLVETDGRITSEGLRVRTAVEKLTDELAAAPWNALRPDETARLSELLLPPVLDIVGAGLLPTPSTLGIGMKYDYQ
ncbi:SCO6745 family protein [Streptomyces sp. NBC_00063]|uniref:SCO6745 family protein n=1 Tax=Streptomyces sp. NBC_00063 TaxID=2975638 RepID=UPI003D74EC7C